MTTHQTAPPAPHQTMARLADASVPTTPDVMDHDGWTVQRLAVINDAAGVCARCGMTGADTVVRGWVDEELVAAHTRCVVGLGPARPGRDRVA
jgi:hypothetical protein